MAATRQKYRLCSFSSQKALRVSRLSRLCPRRSVTFRHFSSNPTLNPPQKQQDDQHQDGSDQILRRVHHQHSEEAENRRCLSAVHSADRHHPVCLLLPGRNIPVQLVLGRFHQYRELFRAGR